VSPKYKLFFFFRLFVIKTPPANDGPILEIGLGNLVGRAKPLMEGVMMRAPHS